MKNRSKVRRLLAEGKIPVGTVMELACPELVEVIGNVGYDFIFVDMEHGLFGVETMLNMVRAAEPYGMDIIVRVLYNEPALITQVLDAGAVGVMVPDIATCDDADKAVRAARYHPRGNRGASPWVRSTGPCLEPGRYAEYTRAANDEVMVWLTIEGEEGVRNFEEIIAVPGVDVALLGPFDLSVSLGIPGQTGHPRIKESFRELAAKANAKNVCLATVTMIQDTSDAAAAAEAAEWKNCGGRILCSGCDKGILADRYRDILKSSRSAVR